MKEKRTSLEVTAPTVEEAIENGLLELELSIDDVDIIYLDEGSKGLFGLGGRHAKIRIVKKGTEFQPDEPLTAPEAEISQNAEPLVKEKKPARKKEKEVVAAPATVNGVEEVELQVARETVSELLEQMRIKAQVTSTFTGETSRDEQGVLVEVTGDDLSILIGKRSETLNALQYISSLIVGKKLGKWIPLLIDVEGYRHRREKQLTQIALRMAEQVTSTGRRQSLEPMPANERRVVHLALRDHPEVTTESSGEEPFRKVVILPKK